MADATAMSAALDIVQKAQAGDRVVVVCSAISGCTDALLEYARSRKVGKALSEVRQRHFAIIRRLFSGQEMALAEQEFDAAYGEMLSSDCPESYGELFSSKIIAAKLCCEGTQCRWIDSRKLIVLRGGRLDKQETTLRIRDAVGKEPLDRVFVAPGFIASDEDGRVCTLGRGGSDYSAAIYAAALDADELTIYTDVPGIMTTNPKDVRQARTIPRLSYECAFTLAEHGAKVLYAPTVEPAREKGLAIDIRDTFHPSLEGSRICALPKKGKGKWIGIASKDLPGKGVSELCLVADGRIGPKALEEVVSRLVRSGVSPLGYRQEDDDHALIEVRPEERKEAVRICHGYCFGKEGVIKLYLAGQGKVGSALLDILDRTENNVSVALISLHESDDEAFFARLLSDTRGKRVFVDCTDSETIHKWYVPVLESGASVVSSNRRALAVPYAEYAAMKRAARENGCTLRYETTVGAALPILDSINMSTNSADRIVSIEAVVSCTLNYILSSGLPFEEALERAKEAGLTEKDPSADLQGRDALRKLLILGREAGIPLEEEDVQVEPVDGRSVRPGQRFVACVETDPTAPKGYRASIRLRQTSPGDPAYEVGGTDNMVCIRSEFHPSPLIIKGAGEGARMAASSVLNDILK